MKIKKYSTITLFILTVIQSGSVVIQSNIYAATEDAISITTTSPPPQLTATEATTELQISLSTLQELATKDPRAAYDLSLRYFRGDGVPQDSYQALQTMRTAAERGLLDAQKALGQLYLTGLEEMGSDLNEAHKWLSIAAGRGDKEASDLLEEVTSARANDREWYKYRNHLHPLTYRYWYHDSLYKLYWRHGYWRYY